MRDPLEGVSPSGTIVTGARRDRVPTEFEPIIAAAGHVVRAHGDDSALFLYGSVATGQARAPLSDVDLIAIDLDPRVALTTSQSLSGRFADMCRGVDIGAARTSDYIGDTDAAYGNRVFLRHYCVHLSGPSRHRPTGEYPADAGAARGFNGDIGIQARRWRLALDEATDVRSLGRRLARKVLFAVAGLVSVHDSTWTTDRAGAARRWAELRPELGQELVTLVHWSDGVLDPTRVDIDRILDGITTEIVRSFQASIGLWH